VRAKAWSIDEEKARVVHSMFEWSAEGMSIESIRKKLTNSGIPSPSGGAKWVHSVVTEMLRQSALQGTALLQLRIGILRIEVPAIVSADLWKQSAGRVDAEEIAFRFARSTNIRRF